MTVLVVLESIVLALLIALVVGLLRTHAEVLRRLHELGAGIYETDASGITQADLAGRVADGVTAPRPESAVRAEVVDSSGSPSSSAVSIAVAGDERSRCWPSCRVLHDLWATSGEPCAMVSHCSWPASVSRGSSSSRRAPRTNILRQ